MSDQTVILLQILNAVDKLGMPPMGRTAIVKTVYLAEILRPAYELWWESYKYERYHYGPYSDDIFRRLDFFIFHGLINVDTYLKIKGKKIATYSITDFGKKVAKESTEQRNGQIIGDLAYDLVWNLQIMGIETAADFIKLVYSEPGFESVAKKKAFQRSQLPCVLDYNHPSFKLQAIVESLQETRIGDNRSPRDIVRTYLRYLSSISQMKEIKKRGEIR